MTCGPATARCDAHLPGAQSTVQLFEQLRDCGLTSADLQRVRAACATALELFAGRMHPSGKPYVAHCTGAASTLAALGADADVVIAGLLHGAYQWGDFGPSKVVLPLRRRDLWRHFGVRTERYVFAFFRRPWRVQAIEALSGQLAGLDESSRQVVLMRLASDLDNLRDGSLLYRANADQARAELHVRGPLLIRIADQLGFPSLSRALEVAVASNLSGTVAPELRSDFSRPGLLLPASSRLRVGAVLARTAHRALQRVRQSG